MAEDNGNPFTDESLTNHPSVEAQPADGNPFTEPLESEIQEHQQAHAASIAASDNGNPFNEPLLSEKTEAQAQNGGPSQEEQQFLQSNPGYKYIAADPKFPNRPAGVYPTGPGNGWRNDPSYSQSPVDLHMARNTAQGAATAAAATAAIPASAMVLGEVAPVIAHLAENLPNLDKAWKIVKIVGGTEYTLQHLKDVLKVLGGGSNNK
jgi:hypothetical protein